MAEARGIRCGLALAGALLLPAGGLHPHPAEQHVVLVIIDGARYSETLGDPSGQYIPRMRQLALQGAVVDTFWNDSTTYTDKAIPAIWCGSWSRPVDTVVNGYSTQYATAPTVWEYYRRHRGGDSTRAIYVLKQLNGPWLPSFHPSYGPPYWPWYAMQDWSDLYVWQNARAKLAAHRPPLMVLYLANVDHEGHSGVWQAYTRAITIADSIVGMLWDFVQADPVLRNTTTVMVTNDHGRHLDGILNGFAGHGDGCAGCRRIEFLALGPAVKPGVSSVRRRIPDIAPTIGAILNFPTPYATGTPMTELLRAILSFAPAAMDFGGVPLNGARTDTLRLFNTGGVPLGVLIEGDSLFSAAPASGTVPAHGEAAFTVTFAPRGEDTARGFVRIRRQDGGAAESVAVTGWGSTLVTLTAQVEEGWNMVSLPVDVADPSVGAVFPGAGSPAYGFVPSSGYASFDTLLCGAGYWLKFPQADTIALAGTMQQTDSVDVAGGWNLIGGGALPLPAASLGSVPPGIILFPLYGYAGSYAEADTLHPAAGYWLKASGPGRVILGAPGRFPFE
ncbi:MAG: alkaline phosphatase family protein [Bacteroidota bacterium]